MLPAAPPSDRGTAPDADPETPGFFRRNRVWLSILALPVVVIVVGFALGQRIRFTKGQWAGIVVFGLCQNALYLGLNFEAMRTVEASVAAVIASLLPLIVAGLGRMFLGDRLPALGIAGLAATTAWFLLVERLGPTRAAAFHFLNPFFGVATAAVVLGERVGLRDVLGVTIVSLGILMVQRARRPLVPAPAG